MPEDGIIGFANIKLSKFRYKICELSLHSLRKGLQNGIKTWVFDLVCYELKSFSMRDFPFFRRPPRWFLFFSRVEKRLLLRLLVSTSLLFIGGFTLAKAKED